MQIKRLPMSILVGLELAAGSSGCNGVSACLSIDPTHVGTETGTGTTGTTGTTETTGTTGTGTTTAGTTYTTYTTCLSPPYTTETDTTGPDTGTTTDTGTSTDTDTDTETDTDTDTDTTDSGGETSTGPCLAPPPFDEVPDDPPATRRAADGSPSARAAIERVLTAGGLPADVLARLRQRLTGDE